jgi:hypothetical protein
MIRLLIILLTATYTVSESDRTFLLSADDVHGFAVETFAEADRDADAQLTVDEFATRALVVAELSRLNQGVYLAQDSMRLGRLPWSLAPLQSDEKNALLSRAQSRFAMSAGPDGLMSYEEYENWLVGIFHDADISGDLRISQNEAGVFLLRVSWNDGAGSP